MPIYEYRCDKGHRFELFQSMSEDPVKECVECSAAAQRVLSAPAVHFKGSGFYTTDYARKGAKQATAGESSSSGGSSSEGSSDSKSEKSSSTEKSSSSSEKSSGTGSGSGSGSGSGD